jgi:hypothetical protein
MLLHGGCSLVWGVTGDVAVVVVEFFRDHFARTGNRGVSIRCAAQHEIPWFAVTLSGGILDEVGDYDWFLENGDVGRALARSIRTSVSFLVYERRGDWEQMVKFDRNGRSTTTSRSLEQSAAAFEAAGQPVDWAARGLPLGVTAATNGLRREHLEAIIDDVPGISCALDEGLPADLSARFDASKRPPTRDLDTRPASVELCLPSWICDDLTVLAKNVRATAGDVFECTWRFAIDRRRLFDDSHGPDGSVIVPFSYRSSKLAEKKLVAAWMKIRRPDASDADRTIPIDLPTRVMFEIEELAAHLDSTVNAVAKRAYQLARP